jgi:tetratricopeptide (TPR) repeat protein
VPRPEDLSGFLPEDLRKSVVESLGDALRECDVDYYLIVGNEIPLITGLIINGLAYTLSLARAFIDKYNEAVAEMNRILNIARGRGGIHDAERLYGLGLVSIIANAARLNRDVESSDADIALRIASFAIKSVALPDLIKSVLSALEPLHGKAPHRYLELLALASDMEDLDLITVLYIFDKLNEILDKYGDAVKEHAWSLVYAIYAYAVLLRKYFSHFNRKEVGDMVGRVVNLLKELGKYNSSLGVIAWADALAPALEYEDVRRLMEETLRIDVVEKANEVLKELNDMKDKVQELMGDKEFMNYIESWSVKADEEAVKIVILEATSLLKHALAHYRLNNSELEKAKKLFNEAAEERRKIGDYENELVARSLALRVEAIEGPLVGEKLVNEFRRLYEETFSKEHFKLTATYLSIASSTLGEYLVSLALTGNYEMINKLLKEQLLVLNAYGLVSVLTRLILNALLSPRGRLSSELKAKLSVNPEELIDTFGYDILRNYLPALMVAFGMIRPEDGYEECMSIEDSTEKKICKNAVLVAADDSDAVGRLRGMLIDYHKQILENERSDWLKELNFDTNELISEFEKLVNGLDGKSLVQLLAIHFSTAPLALILHALINGNGKLAKALALYGAINSSSKLLGRLYLEAYRACCDLKSESFRHAIARLFFLHV